MTPNRILHVISSLDEIHGGPTLALKHLALAQHRRGMPVKVAMTFGRQEDPRVTTLLRASGIEVLTIGPCLGKLMWHPATGRVVRSAIDSADIVHVHGLWEDVHHQAAAASRRIGRPYVMRPCGMLDPWSLARSRWLKQLFLAARLRTDLNRAAAIHFTSALERESAAPLRLHAPTVVEGNGIDLDLFRDRPPRGRFKARLPFGDRPFVLFLGRVTPKKGLDLIVRALAEPRCAGICLAVVGPDEQPFRTRVDALVRELGVADRVHFAGMLRGPSVVDALVDAEISLLPSLQENFATSVLESLAAGTPVIVSDQVDIHPDISREAVGAVIPRTVEALASALAEWMADPDRRRSAGQRARAYGLRHGWDGIAERWAGHYSRLIASHRPQPA